MPRDDSYLEDCMICNSRAAIKYALKLYPFFLFQGAVYGNGVYFAINSSYSARSRYSPPDDKRHRYMYLARVLVGEYTEGRQGLITPPPKDLNNVTDTYHTVVDKISDPSIVVVFYDWQCYPEYLITFSEVGVSGRCFKQFVR